MNQSLGYIMFLAGAFMLLVSFVFPMVTVLVDNTPPTWIMTSDGKVGITPRNGETYSLVTSVIVFVKDEESGVESVKATVDTTTYDCSSMPNFWYSGIFPALPVGSHSIKVVATNGVGLSTTYSGTFTVYTNLQGNWYVNGVQITDPAQVIKATSLIVNFQFDKTLGVEDSKITCTVVEGSTVLLTLTNTVANTWKGSYTFTTGQHSLTLKASDGTQTVTMSVIGMQIGPTTPKLPQLNTLQILGLASTGIGLLLIFTGRKRG